MFSAAAWRRFQGGWPPELPSTCSGKIPRSSSFPQSLSRSWLSSCRSCFKSVFSQLLFPGLPGAAAAVHFSWSPFFWERFALLTSCPPPLLRPSYPSPSPAPFSLPNSSCNHLPTLLPLLPSQLGERWLCLCSSLTTLWTSLSPALCRGGAQSKSCVVLSNVMLSSRAFCFNGKSN